MQNSPTSMPHETPESRRDSIKKWTAELLKNLEDGRHDTVIAATSNAIGRTIIQLLGVACESTQYEFLIIKGNILEQKWMIGLPEETRKIIEDGIKAVKKAVAFNPDKKL